MIRKDSPLLDGLNPIQIDKLAQHQAFTKNQKIEIDENDITFVCPKKDEVNEYLQFVIKKYCEDNKLDYKKLSKTEYFISNLEKNEGIKDGLLMENMKNISIYFHKEFGYDIDKLNCTNIVFRGFSKDTILI